jgi:hypothetical protein
MKFALGVSLTINVLVIAVIVGAVAGRHGPGGGMPRDPASAVYLRALPSELRNDVVAELDVDAGDLVRNRAALRREVDAALAILRAETFDAEAFRAALTRQRQHLAERGSLADRRFAEAVARLSLEERRAYADRIEGILARIERWRRD